MASKASLVLAILVIAFTINRPPTTEGLLEGLLGLINVQGTLYCTANGNINGTSTPVFSNALVQLQCGTGNTVASAITNGSGVFSMFLNPIQYLLPSLLGSCKLVVKTPLSNCDVSLPSVGGLISSIQSLGNIVQGILSITQVIPTGFQFLANVN